MVTTEPSHFDNKCLKLALNQLIVLSQDERAEVRIHAYNILRVLYRDSTLGEVVSPFVTDGLIAAILGFKATSWSVSFNFYILQKSSLKIRLWFFVNFSAQKNILPWKFKFPENLPTRSILNLIFSFLAFKGLQMEFSITTKKRAFEVVFFFVLPQYGKAQNFDSFLCYSPWDFWKPYYLPGPRLIFQAYQIWPLRASFWYLLWRQCGTILRQL